MQLPFDHDPARDRQAASPNGEPEGAATLTAAMVRRGHNPWWGKDQIPADAAAGAEDDGANGGGTPEPDNPRKPFHRIELDDGGTDDSNGDGADNAGTKRFRFDWRDGALWRDIAVFFGVFFTAASAILYLSLRAL